VRRGIITKALSNLVGAGFQESEKKVKQEGGLYGGFTQMKEKQNQGISAMKQKVLQIAH